MAIQRTITQSTQSSTLADLLERILDKGIVIAGDIKIKLVEVELLTIQIRLVICSVDKAKEMGMDWWVNNPAFDSHPRQEFNGDHLDVIEKRLAALEATSEVSDDIAGARKASAGAASGAMAPVPREAGVHGTAAPGGWEAETQRRRLKPKRPARDKGRTVRKAKRPSAKGHRGS